MRDVRYKMRCFSIFVSNWWSDQHATKEDLEMAQSSFLTRLKQLFSPTSLYQTHNVGGENGRITVPSPVLTVFHSSLAEKPMPFFAFWPWICNFAPNYPSWKSSCHSWKRGHATSLSRLYLNTWTRVISRIQIWNSLSISGISGHNQFRFPFRYQ